MIARDPSARHRLMMVASILTGGLPMRVVEAVEDTAVAVTATRSRTPAPSPPRVGDPKLAKYLRTSKPYKRGGGAKGR